MAQLYHWPVSCTICESPAEHHCNTCGDVLCSKCRDNHLKSNATRHHDLVPYSQRTEPTKTSLQCGDHSGHQCGVWCRTCNKAVCSECVTSPNHEGHRFLKFDVKMGERRKEIQNQFEKYSKLVSDWQKSLQDAQKLTETYEKDVKKLDKEIVNRADELCRQVRDVERESRKQLQEMKDVALRVLQDQKKKLADGLHRLKEKINEIEDTLRSRDSSTILQYSVVEENIPGEKPLTDDLPPVPVFTPGSLNIQVLKNMFGSISDNRDSVPSIKPILVQSQGLMSMLAKPSVESVITIDCGGYTPALACVGSGQAWVQTKRRRLQLIDRKDKVKRTVNIEFDMADMAMTPLGSILLPDYTNKCIRSMSMEGEITTLFDTQWEPYGICCLPSGDIVVVFRDDNKVVQYSSTGKIIREFGSSLFVYKPLYLAYSPFKLHLYVCDRWEYGAGRILAFTMNGQQQYTYTGSDMARFTPWGVCTDLAGHVLITDSDNNRVHILDKAGKLLQYLDEEHGSPLTEPRNIDVDNEGCAWIGELNTGKQKLVKYMK